VKLAGCGACAAFDAEFRINTVRHLFFSGDSAGGAGFYANAAALALRRNDFGLE